jgi:hypothetical protein
MSVRAEGKPLSDYLKGLVDQRSVPAYVAEILNSLPDWKQQREAVKEWNERLTEPAREVVAEFERKNKGIAGTLDFLLDFNVVHVKDPFVYLEENIDEYIDHIRSGLEDFMAELSCPVCEQSLGGGQRHIDCNRLDGFRFSCSLLSDLQKMGETEPNDDVRLQEYELQVNELEAALKSRHLKDGTPWNAPNTYSEMRKAKISQANEESSSGPASSGS